jgi:hypothetical protein
MLILKKLAFFVLVSASIHVINHIDFINTRKFVIKLFKFLKIFKVLDSIECVFSRGVYIESFSIEY